MQEHQRQSFGVYGDLVVHGGVVAVQGLPAALNGSVEYIHKVVGRFALRDGRARVVCAALVFTVPPTANVPCFSMDKGAENAEAATVVAAMAEQSCFNVILFSLCCLGELKAEAA